MKFFICSVVLLSVVSTLQAASLFNCRNPGLTCFNGRCVGGRCVCNFGWAGETCLINTISESLCSTLGCSGNGLCVRNSIGVDRCVCNEGFSGANCQTPPMTCDCTATTMTVTMEPPGDFSSGMGYAEGNRRVAQCSGQKVPGTNEMTISVDHDECGALTPLDLTVGVDRYVRNFIFYYYNDSLITSNGIQFTCTCIYTATTGVFYATIGVDGNDLTNLIQVEGISYISPVSYSLRTATGFIVSRNTFLAVGDPLVLTVTADNGYCVVVNRITVNNTLTGINAKQYTLLENGCVTEVGLRAFTEGSNPVYTSLSVLNQVTMNLDAFLLDYSNQISLAIYFTANPQGFCSLPACITTGRKKRQAGNEATETAESETSGTFQQIIFINNPEAVQEETTPVAKECRMSTHVMIGLIAMAGIICILLIICFVVGLRMIMAKKRSTVEPPAYK